jgi:glycosyltransferase involved in cell wall biosynthesis
MEALVRADQSRRSSLLLILPLPLRYDEEGCLMIESQAANGLERWADHFDKVTAACILTPDSQLETRTSVAWRRVQDLRSAHRVEVIPLPWAYKPALFMSHYKKTRDLLRDRISDATYLCFGIGFLWGDWAALGCFLAIRQRKPYAVWTDLVDHHVVRYAAEGAPLLRHVYRKYVLSNMIRLVHSYLIKRSHLGLFHGKDCYEAYAPLSSNPHVVHNIHLKRQDAISADRLAFKAAEIRSGGPIRLGYVGRADASKGVSDWLDAVRMLVDSGHAVEATWLGDGPELAKMRTTAERMRLANHIHLPGFVRDRGQVLEFLKNTHILMFCHKVPESPRALIESLVCGAPIVGYDSPYPRDLIGEHRCGSLTPQHDVHSLVQAIRALDHDRDQLAKMVMRTSFAPELYNDEAVFRHRSELIKTHLPAGMGQADQRPGSDASTPARGNAAILNGPGESRQLSPGA